MNSFYNKVSRNLKELGKLTPFAILTTFMPIIGGTLLLIFAIPLGQFFREDLIRGVPVFLFGMLILVGLSIMTTNIIATLGGWAFGFEIGTIVLMVGVVVSGLISYYISRKIAGNKLTEIFEKRPKLKAVYAALLRNHNWQTTLIIFLIRLSPAFPFGLTNIVLASAKVSLRSFILGTFFGMLPRTAALVFVGSQLAELKFDNQQDTKVLILGIIATIVCVIFIGIVSKRALTNLTSERQSVEVPL